MSLIIRPVSGKEDWKRFIRLPWKLYKHDKNWVPPLLTEQKKMFDSGRFPFFEHSSAAFFLAEKEGETVGRIAAIRNNNHLAVYHDHTGFFGFFECIDDQHTANLLFKEAESWLKAEGLKGIRGPENYSQNEEAGLLVDGFDAPPVIMMTYNPEYYASLMENYGFEKKRDLYAYALDGVTQIPERLVTAADMMQKRYKFTVRTINMKKLDEEVEKIQKIYNAAWSENWGAVPLTPKEIEKLKEDLLQIAKPKLLFIAEMDGEPVGVSITIPDINEALIKMDGTLFPTGVFKYLWNERKIKGLRVLIMGVLKEYRNMGIDLNFYYLTFKNGLKLGYNKAEMSWILENNLPMRNALEKIPRTRIYKTYRIYEKSIS